MINVRLALHTLFRTPFVTIFAIVSIALGIGANTAIFSLVDHFILQSLPVQEPDRLVNLSSSPGPTYGSSTTGLSGNQYEVFSYPMFLDLEKEQTDFTGIAAHSAFSANLSAQDRTVGGMGAFVSGSYFPVLGIRPALGRLLNEQDDRAVGESPVVVLSHAYWDTHFGRSPDVLNQTMLVNGQTMTVVGVAPRGFDGTTLGLKPKVFVPITMREILNPYLNSLNNRFYDWIYLFARLKPDVAAGQAQTALNGKFHTIIQEVEAPQTPGFSEQQRAQFKAKQLILKTGSRGQSMIQNTDSKGALILLLGLTAAVLIIACANVANLLMVRGTARAEEIAIRLSLGAGRFQVIKQLLTESLLLAFIAGGAGILVAQWTLDAIVSVIPAEDIANFGGFALNRSAIIFAAILTLGTGLLFGLFPALHSTQRNLIESLKNRTGQPAGARTSSRFRTVLTVAQIALSLALLITAGFFTKNLAHIYRIDPGMDVDRVVTFEISPARNGYARQQSINFFQKLEDELEAVPGVESVSSSMASLLTGNFNRTSVLTGHGASPDTDLSSLNNEIGPGFFRTLGIPLISGREFTRSDSAESKKVVIVDEMLAEKLNLGRKAVGSHIRTRTYPYDFEIVGLVKNSRYIGLKTQPEPVFYFPGRQDYSINPVNSLTFYIRTTRNPDLLFPAIKQVAARLDPNLPVENLATMPQQIRNSLTGDRVMSLLTTAFGCLATLLAAVGLYGVISYSVARRTREIGLRIALGASQSQVRAMVLREVCIMTVIGGGIGLFLAVLFGLTIQSHLYQLQGYDPFILSGSVLALALVAFAAGFIPAYHASRIDPMQALRYE